MVALQVRPAARNQEPVALPVGQTAALPAARTLEPVALPVGQIVDRLAAENSARQGQRLAAES
jgi:hypothetical protein